MENNAYKYLAEHGIRPSVQRIAIMEYLMKYHVHPTADAVYQALSKKMPTLSKTTVYNTLNAFAEASAVTAVTIDGQHICYDVDTRPHAHFLCKECGRLMDMEDFSARDFMVAFPARGCEVEEVHLYYKGICNECRLKRND